MLFRGGEFVSCFSAQEVFDVSGGSIEDNFDIGIASCPGMRKDFSGKGVEKRDQQVAKVVESVAQGGAPFLIPGWIRADMAAAVTAPAFDTMGAAP